MPPAVLNIQHPHKHAVYFDGIVANVFMSLQRFNVLNCLGLLDTSRDKTP